MTPIEKAENALNSRIQYFQSKLAEQNSEATRRTLVQALVVYVGIGEAIADYVRTLNQFATSRFATLKQEQAKLTAEHAELLSSGETLLTQLKADPTDRAVRKEIERAQQKMEAVQKTLRRSADALQREISPGVRLLDEMAATLRYLAEAEDALSLKRATKKLTLHAQELFRHAPQAPHGLIDAATWEASAVEAIDQSQDFYEAHARAGTQAVLALALMSISLSAGAESVPESVLTLANGAVTKRLTEIAARLSSE